MKYHLSKNTFKRIVKWIQINADVIHEILSPIATYQSIQEEIHKSIRTLDNAIHELEKYNPPIIDHVAVYHPSNAIFYSYVLYAIIPSAYAKMISIRPAKITVPCMLKIHELFKKEFDFPIYLKLLSQKKFKELTQQANLIVFTGRYENSLEVANQYPHSVFVFFGSGYNPIVFNSDVDIQNAVDITLKARIFNSGQDCFMSDIFFIHSKIRQKFISALTEKIRKLKFGLGKNSDYGPIIYDNIFSTIKFYLDRYLGKLVYRENIDEKKRLISPIIFLSKIDDMVNPTEFFSPIFNVVTYDHISDVKTWLMQKESLENAMALSIYGDSSWSTDLMDKYNLLIEQTVMEAENGNEPFGGYGIRSNYIKQDGKFVVNPILLSKTVFEYFHNPIIEKNRGSVLRFKIKDHQEKDAIKTAGALTSEECVLSERYLIKYSQNNKL